MQVPLYRCTEKPPHPKAGAYVTKTFYDANKAICVEEPFERDNTVQFNCDLAAHFLKESQKEHNSLSEKLEFANEARVYVEANVKLRQSQAPAKKADSAK